MKENAMLPHLTILANERTHYITTLNNITEWKKTQCYHTKQFYGMKENTMLPN